MSKRRAIGIASVQGTALAAILFALCAEGTRTESCAALAGNKYLLDTWETDGGLPQNSVIAMAQTPEGFLWLSTFSGLARFDGMKFRAQTLTGTTDSSGPPAIVLYVDHKAKLWAAVTPPRILSFQDGSWTDYGQPQGWPGGQFISILEDREGDLLVASDQRLFKFDRGQLVPFPSPVLGVQEQLVQCVVDREGTLWVISGGYCGRFLDGSWQAYPVPLIGTNRMYTALAPGREGGVWLADRQRVWNLQKDRATLVHAGEEGAAPYQALCEDDNGRLWIGGERLLVLERNGQLIPFTREDGWDQASIRVIFKDRESNVWIGTDGAGLTRIKSRPFQVFDEKSGLGQIIVDSVLEEFPNRLLIATYGGGTFRLAEGQISPAEELQSAGSSILAMAQDDQGRLWISDYSQGISWFKGGKLENKFPEWAGSDRVHAFFQDSRKTMWLGTESGLASCRDGQFTRYGTNTGFEGSWITAIAETQPGELWFGGKGGLFHFAGGRVESYASRAGASFTRVLSLHVDGDNALWIGSSRQGLGLIAGGKFYVFSEQAGMPLDASIGGIMSDNQGYLWIATDRRGILRVPRKELKRFMETQNGSVDWREFGKRDGLRSTECRNAMFPTVCQTRDGRLWFATMKGVACADPAAIRTNSLPPAVLLEDVKLDGRSMAWQAQPESVAGLKFPPGSGRIEVDYTGLGFSAPERLRFRYRLQGVQEDWVNAGIGRSALFIGLKPGRYRFEVQAQNVDGIWSENSADLAFAVAPFYWQTWPFRVLLLIFVGGGAAWGMRWFQRSRLRRVQERLEQQEALAQERARSAALTQHASDVVTLLDAQGLVIYESPSTTRILGYPAGFITGKSPIEFVHPEDQPRVREAFNRVMNHTSRGVAVPFRFKHSSGKWIYLESLGSNLLDQPGVNGILVTTRDISERRKVEEKLNMLSLAVEQGPTIVVLTDPEGTIEYVNQMFVDVTGYSREEAIGQNPRILKSGECPPEAYRELWSSIKAGQSWEGEFHNRKKNGELYWESAVISPVKDSTGTIIHMLAEKLVITERKQAEEAKLRLEAQLRQAQKMEALGTLAGGIAHDFNNILAAIIAFNELAQLEAQDRPEVLSSLKEVAKASGRAKDLVQQILAFSRQSQQERKPLLLQPVVKEALKLLRSTLPATIELVSDIKVETPPILGDPTQIHQVLMNLCSNSAHAMRGKPGRLTVVLEPRMVSQELAVANPDLQPGLFARLVVEDTGHGMDAETIKRVFDPFFTTKGPGEGTGLGLAVVHGIVKDHQGAILLDSSSGKGTTFQLYFPGLPDQEPTKPAATPAISPGKGENILFIDDEVALCQTGRKMLERLGYQVTTRHRPEEALALFKSNPESYDAVVTDLTMPGMTGIALAQELLQIRPGLPVVLMSGFIGLSSPEAAQSAGIREVITKPFSLADVSAALEKALAAHRAR